VLHKGLEPGHEEVLEGKVETVIHEIAVAALSCSQMLYGKYKFKPPLSTGSNIQSWAGKIGPHFLHIDFTDADQTVAISSANSTDVASPI